MRLLCLANIPVEGFCVGIHETALCLRIGRNAPLRADCAAAYCPASLEDVSGS